MGVQFTLCSENRERDVLYYSKFIPHSDRSRDAYDRHISPEITHFIGTRGVMLVEGREYEILPGDIFIIHSNEKHRILRVDIPGEIENLRFDPAFIWQGSDSFSLNYLDVFDAAHASSNVRLERGNPVCAAVRSQLEEIRLELAEAKFGYQHMVRMRLNMILLTLLREFGDGSASSALRARNTEGVRSAMRYIDEHLEEELSVPGLAEHAGLSANYFGTLFKQVNGITPVEYITSKRVLRAIELLPDFCGTMLELALVCGFNNTASFNRAFRAYTGQVPSKYVPPVK